MGIVLIMRLQMAHQHITVGFADVPDVLCGISHDLSDLFIGMPLAVSEMQDAAIAFIDHIRINRIAHIKSVI